LVSFFVRNFAVFPPKMLPCHVVCIVQALPAFSPIVYLFPPPLFFYEGPTDGSVLLLFSICHNRPGSRRFSDFLPPRLLFSFSEFPMQPQPPLFPPPLSLFLRPYSLVRHEGDVTPLPYHLFFGALIFCLLIFHQGFPGGLFFLLLGWLPYALPFLPPRYGNFLQNGD